MLIVERLSCRVVESDSSDKSGTEMEKPKRASGKRPKKRKFAANQFTRHKTADAEAAAEAEAKRRAEVNCYFTVLN